MFQLSDAVVVSTLPELYASDQAQYEQILAKCCMRCTCRDAGRLSAVGLVGEPCIRTLFSFSKPALAYFEPFSSGLEARHNAANMQV